MEYKKVLVKGGTFTMGALEGDAYAHEVALTHDYYIGATEVTQELYEAVMGTNPSHFSGFHLPVEEVSYDDAIEFCKRLSRLTGKRFTLPTEVQWEYAARGGHKMKKLPTLYAGSDNIDEVAWYWQNSGDGYLPGTDDDWHWETIKTNNCRTHEVGAKKPNELGLYDMSGNVWEWCLDWYGKYNSAVQRDPYGANKGSFRVGRGGCWFNLARICRASFRGNFYPEFSNFNLGFRVVMFS